MSHGSLGQQTLGQDPGLEVTHAKVSLLCHHSLTGHCPSSMSWWPDMNCDHFPWQTKLNPQVPDVSV